LEESIAKITVVEDKLSKPHQIVLLNELTDAILSKLFHINDGNLSQISKIKLAYCPIVEEGTSNLWAFGKL